MGIPPPSGSALRALEMRGLLIVPPTNTPAPCVAFGDKLEYQFRVASTARTASVVRSLARFPCGWVKVHPNPAGGEKMAKNFVDALLPLLH